MSYTKDGNGYQEHSDTSQEAAENVSGKAKMHAIMCEFIKINAADGATIDECAVRLSAALQRDVPIGTVSARMIELERAGSVSKTPARRKTRSKRNAVVYVWGSWAEQIVPVDKLKPIPQKPCPANSPLSQLEEAQGRSGHGWVIPRADGKKNECGGPSKCYICHQVHGHYLRLQAMEGMKK